MILRDFFNWRNKTEHGHPVHPKACVVDIGILHQIPLGSGQCNVTTNYTSPLQSQRIIFIETVFLMLY